LTSNYSFKSLKRSLPLLILMLPALATTILFDYVTLYGIQIAFRMFRVREGIWGSEWVGLDHFIRFVRHPNFFMMLRNTLNITVYTLALFPLTVIVALMINEIRSLRYKKVVQMVSYAPHFLSVVVIVSMINLFLARPTGLFNNVLYMINGTRIDFMSNPSAFPHIFVWSGVWQSIGFGTIIYLAALAGVSPELVDAAKIDGANKLQIIRHVNIPAILPTVVILFILATGGVLSLGAERIILMQNPLNRPGSEVFGTYIFTRGILGGEFSYTTAISVFNSAVNLVVILIVNKIASKVSGIGVW